MTKDDYIIICGDFSGVWCGDEGERKRLEELNDCGFTMLFGDRNYEKWP